MFTFEQTEETVEDVTLMDLDEFVEWINAQLDGGPNDEGLLDWLATAKALHNDNATFDINAVPEYAPETLGQLSYRGDDTPDGDRDNGWPASGSHHISNGRWLGDRIQMFNPHHDARGRFASGGGSTGFGVNAYVAGIAAVYHGSAVELVDPAKIKADPRIGRAAAAAYEAMPMDNSAAHASYQQLTKEVRSQFDALTAAGIKVSFVDHDPYDSPEAMTRDVTQNRHLSVMRTATTGPHPYFSNTDNDQFRAIHDVFGHAMIGADFSRNGERAAFLQHSRMFSDLALGALVTETHGQNSAYVYGGGNFPSQKVGILPRETWGI